jgi:PP-loop family
MSRIAPNVLSATPRPIGVAEFASALSKVLGGSQVDCHGQLTAIGINKFYLMITRLVVTELLLTDILGLAVSGGVDSIALATLCSRLQRPASLKSSYEAESSDSSVLKSLQNLKFQAFVVDHGLRLGSDTEAQSVSKVLENRGDSPRVFKASRLMSI